MIQTYGGNDPQYVKHGPEEDILNIMCCQIKVWNAKAPNWFSAPKSPEALIVTEVVSVEIHRSYKDVISTAVVRIPTGAIVEHSIVFRNMERDVATGHEQKNVDLGREVKLKKSSSTGEVLIQGNYIDTHGAEILSVNTKRDDGALMDYMKSVKRLVNQHDFAAGNRIEIKLLYVRTDKEAEAIKNGTDPDSATLYFSGFIKSCSANAPFEVVCEDMGYLTKQIPSKKIKDNASLTVNDLFKDGGKYDLLKGTGIKLDKDTAESEINIGYINVSQNLNVYDILHEWSKSGLLCYFSEDGKFLRVANMSTKMGDMNDQEKKNIDYNPNKTFHALMSDWDVVEDRLQIQETDKKFVAVKAIGFMPDGKSIQLYLRLNPDVDNEGQTDFQVVNIKDPKPRKKKGQKRKGGASPKDTKPKADLKSYIIRTYISPNRKDMSMKKLEEETKDFWKRCSVNGISGSLVVFGDLHILPHEIIGNVNVRHPEKNGYYMVESVDTTFSVDGGFRQEIKIPYKIANFQKAVDVIK